MIITIARQMGSGGEDVGKLVAKRLSVAYVDREILLRAAQAGELSEEALRKDDERPPSLLERITAYFGRVSMPAGASEFPLREPLPVVETEYDSHRHLVEGAIQQIAQTDSAVIVGRGAQVILREQAQAFHVYIYAPDEVRIRHIAEREGISGEEATSRVHESDRNRAGYLKVGYGIDWRDPGLYDLVINTARIDKQTAADLIVRAVQAVSPPAAMTS